MAVAATAVARRICRRNTPTHSYRSGAVPGPTGPGVSSLAAPLREDARGRWLLGKCSAMPPPGPTPERTVHRREYARIAAIAAATLATGLSTSRTGLAQEV